MIYELIEVDSAFIFAGFGLGFFLGNLVSLIKYLIGAAAKIMQS